MKHATPQIAAQDTVAKVPVKSIKHFGVFRGDVVAELGYPHVHVAILIALDGAERAKRLLEDFSGEFGEVVVEESDALRVDGGKEKLKV